MRPAETTATGCVMSWTASMVTTRSYVASPGSACPSSSGLRHSMFAASRPASFCLRGPQAAEPPLYRLAPHETFIRDI